MSQTAQKVTVLMPVYNGERYLREAVNSILAQTFGNFEFLIIDDGSTDGTADILRSYGDTRLRLARNETNLGIIATLNKGLDLARGEYVARMDSDDVALPERLARQVAFMDEHPEVGVCGGAIRLMGAAPSTIIVNPVEHEDIRTALLIYNAVAHPTAMIRVSQLREFGWRYDDYPAAEDYDLWVRAAEQTQFHNLPEVLLRYRITKQSVTHSRRATLSGTLRRIHGAQLERLGIPADERTLRLHARLGAGFVRASNPDHAALRDHAHHLTLGNAANGIYDPDALERAIAGRFDRRRLPHYLVDRLLNRIRRSLW